MFNSCLIHWNSLRFAGSVRAELAASTVTSLYSLISQNYELCQNSKRLFQQRIELFRPVNSETITYARIYIVVYEYHYRREIITKQLSLYSNICIYIHTDIVNVFIYIIYYISEMCSANKCSSTTTR